MLITTALAGSLVLTPAVLADETIDGSSETVIGTGGGTQTSPWDASGILTVGNTGTGTLTVSEGGAVTNTKGYVGRQIGSTGTVTVTGSGSTWTNAQEIYVGENGDGTLTVANGGEVTNVGFGTVGLNSGSKGTFIITGTGSKWTTADNTAVGVYGDGTLTITDGGIASVRNMTLGHELAGDVGTGTVTVSGAGAQLTTLTLIVGYQGQGTLDIANGGKVISSGNGILGSVTGATGAATVTGAGSSWTNAGLEIGTNGAGILTIANGGSVTSSNGSVIVAVNSGSIGTLNIGAASGDTAVAAGTLNADTVSFGAGTGKIVFNHTDTDYTFGADISGNGSIEFLSGTTRLTGSNTYTGGTTVTNGLLTVNGSTGDIILNGGTLGGSGTVGNVTTSSGASVAPGNSIGTLNVSGNIDFASGATYEVEVDNAGNSDKVAATGTATINSGASVNVTAENGTDNGSTYAASTTYTILSAAGGVTGTFGSVTDNFAYLDAALGYDANNVTLTLIRNAAGLASIAKTANQSAAAQGVGSLNAGNSVYDAVIVLSEAGARAAFDSLSGEIHASTNTLLTQNTRFGRDAVGNRIRSAFDGLAANEQPMIA
ncbi:autotransporter outer membrane beta-barrel domain-containing protein, partial [Roseibium sp.]|uniref:autotransporter outer membrane beta-barrel domain-containing protein n=1 Tax=Roseibium sp. TaxID=1936156 RepID=UPI003A96C6E3